MIAEVLSGHPRALLQATAAAIAAEQEAAEAHAQTVEALRASQAASRRWWQLGRRAEHRRALRALQARAPGQDPRLRDRYAQQAAGLGAEERMTEDLAALSDDWRVFCGYANHRGEVDQLAVGPGGVWAIEVKNRAVHVYVDGDDWTFEKFDRYGNLKETGELSDRRGRSWGRQVSDVAEALERLLVKRGPPVAVHTAVVVMNARARLGTHRGLGVDLLCLGSAPLLEQLSSAAPVLDRAACADVARLVRRDHDAHARRRRSPSRR